MRSLAISAFWLSTAIASVIFLVKDFRAEPHTWDRLYWVRQIPVEIQVAIDDDEIWKATMELSSLRYRLSPNAETFACLLHHSDCRGAGGHFLLVDKQSQRLRWAADPSDEGDGLDLDGQACRRFPSGYEGPACLVRWDLSWKPQCPVAGPCLNPPIMISGRAKLSKGFEVGFPVIRDPHYSFSFLRKSGEFHLGESCATVGGRFNPLNVSCRIHIPKELGTACPDRTFAVSMSADGTGECRRQPAGIGVLICPSGFLLSGVLENGQVRCMRPHCSLGMVTAVDVRLQGEPGVAQPGTCSAGGGVYDGANGNCRLSSLGACPYGVVLSKDSFTMICGLPWRGACPTGYVAQTLQVGEALKCVKFSCENALSGLSPKTVGGGFHRPFASESWFVN